MRDTRFGTTPAEPGFGLALGGGAVLGFAHVGVLHALVDAGLHPTAVSGTSAGAVVAALHAFGVPVGVIRRRMEDLTWREITGLTLPHRGLLSNRELGRRLIELIGDVRIEDARIPFAVVAVDIGTGEKVVFRSGSVADAVMASACIPGLFVPVERDGRLLVDGAIVEDVPISPLRETGVAPIVGVSLCARPRFQPPRRLIEVMTNAIDIAMAANSAKQLAAVDVAIVPKLNGFNRFDVRQCPALFEVGYAAAVEALPEIRAALDRAGRTDPGRGVAPPAPRDPAAPSPDPCAGLAALPAGQP
jgi:NTE family protein